MPRKRRGRKKPGKHTVHPRHPRYDVTQYERGKGELLTHESGRVSQPLALSLTNVKEAEGSIWHAKADYENAVTFDEKARIVGLTGYAAKQAKRKGHRDVAKLYEKANRDLVVKLRSDMREARKHPEQFGHGKRDLDRARFLHSTRSPQSQRVDEAIEATQKHDPASGEWEGEMNRSDIKGVDFFPVPLSSELKKKDNFDLNNQLIKTAWEDHFNTTLNPDLEFMKGGGEGRKYFAQHNTRIKRDKETGDIRVTKEFIRYSKPAWKVIESGKIEDLNDWRAIKAIAHETGHSSRNRALAQENMLSRRNYGHTSQTFEEGSNEISAFRFAFHTLQIPPMIRKEIRANPGKCASYKRATQNVADIALLVNEGDEEKSIKWIDEMRTEADHRERLSKDLEKSKFVRDYQKETDRTINDFTVLTDASEVRYILEKNGVTPTSQRRMNTLRYPGKENEYWMLLM